MGLRIVCESLRHIFDYRLRCPQEFVGFSILTEVRACLGVDLRTVSVIVDELGISWMDSSC
eukprot:9179517-Lingulodinium_polyedra.AAC.1